MAVNEYQHDKASEQWHRYVYCRDNGHSDFITKADKCDNFFRGLQWLQADLDALRAQRRPALTLNKIMATLSTIFGEQIQNRMEVSFRPKSGAPAGNADVLNKVWTSIGDNNQLQWTRSDVFADGLIRSRGFYDARIEFDDNMYGEVRIEKLNSKNVVVDPDAEDYDPDRWNDVFLTKWLTPGDIELYYSKESADELRDRTSSRYMLWGFDSVESSRDRFSGPQQIGAYANDSGRPQQRYIRVLERQFRELVKVKMFVDPVNGDMREVPENWDRNRIADVAGKYGLSVINRMAKKIRWRVTADDLVLHDESSPYKHFTVVPFFPHFRNGQTIGIVENLLGPQELLNKTTSQELHVINTSANSGWKIKKGSLANMSTEELEANGARTGLVMELDEVANAEKIQPNQIPQGLDRLSYKAEEAIKSISNVSDSMQGFDREDVAAKAIAAKTQRGSVNFAKVMDNLERTDWLLARNVLDMVQTFYTEPRLLNITHDRLSGGTEELSINQEDPETGDILNDLTLGEYDVVVTSSPFRATLEDSQFDQAVAMRQLGVPIPDEVLIENSRLMRKTELVKELAAAKQDPVAQRTAEAGVAKLEAEVADIQASAEQKRASAAKSMSDAQNPAGKAPEAEMAMEKYKVDQEIALAREKQAAEMEMAREKQVFDMQLKQEESRQKALERRAQMALQAATPDKQPATAH